MNRGNYRRLTLLFVLSVSFIVASLITFLLTYYYSYLQFQRMGNFCGEILEKYPDCKQSILEILKSNKASSVLSAKDNILLSFGYQQSDFLEINGQILLIASAGFLAGGLLFFFSFCLWNKNKIARIKTLTSYLEKVNAGGQGVLFDTLDDEFSRLQDEIYKTITTLYQTRDTALEEKSNFANNLSNIAHQIKTPITAISLSIQMMKEHPFFDYSEQIRRQLNRLTHLEEALLLMSRIDAGTLVMKQVAVDVFTLLTLASDNLQELFMQNAISVDIPEAGEIDIIADLDWTMEAMINLMKNCMEHTKAGTTVHCSYEKNDASFLEYCSQIGIAPSLDGAIVLNRIWDSINSNFRYKEYVPFVKENKKKTTLHNTDMDDQDKEIPILSYTQTVPVLREEYKNYALVHFIPIAMWKEISEPIGGVESDSYIRIFSSADADLDDLNSLEKVVVQILEQKYEVESENRIQEKLSDDSIIRGMVTIFGAFCALLAIIGIANVFSNTLGFLRQRKREFAQYMSIGLTPQEMRQMFCIEAFVIAGKPLLFTFPLTVLFVQFAVTVSYLEPRVFWAEAPVLPIMAFAAAIIFFVALAYYIGGKRLLQCDLNETLRNDALV